MQKIRTTRWPVRNIGGDRSRCKLRYVIGTQFDIAAGAASKTQNLAMNIGTKGNGSDPISSLGIEGVLGQTPNLQTMAALYTQYRIRGIKLRLTYWQQTGVPVFLFTNAQTDIDTIANADTGPTPDFVSPQISTLPEQRWAKYRVCQMTATGGRATSLSAYYSVNKVYGPDNIVRNDLDFIGAMRIDTPYWSNSGSPNRGAWCQWGIANLSGANGASTGVLKVEATVYCEFFGKRVTTS